MSKSILVVDDHPIVLYGLKFLFEGDESFTVCGEAGDVSQARELAAARQPDFIILDLVLGGRDGLELLRELRALSPASRILVYSSQNELFFGRKCAAAGAWGYLSKSEGLPAVARALAMVAEGVPYFEHGETGATPDLPPIEQLSARELQVLRMIGEGSSSRAMSEALGLSIKTIGTYRERIKAKLMLANVRDLDDLARDYAEGRLA